MTPKLFHSTSCLSTNASRLSKTEMLNHGFKDGAVDRRFFTQALNKFINYNRVSFDFLGVIAQIEGLDPNPSLCFDTGPYIGAIPLRMPGTGKQGGDFLVFPRFGKRSESFEKLTKIMALLEDVIRPEFMHSLPLASGAMVRPPLYYDALKYVDLFETATHRQWRKFRVNEDTFPYPKANTRWDEYARHSYQPEKALSFPVTQSVLSLDHSEWRMLKYVLLLAVQELKKPSTPQQIRIPYLQKADALLQKTKDISPQTTHEIPEHFTDPIDIKHLKEQAKLLLKQEGSALGAWRMDIALLFERYVQYVIAKSVAELPARLLKNPHFSGRGDIPAWGLRQLEPDALIMAENAMIAVDAKYKAHFYGQGVVSQILKDAHRADLHQILAYCSFADSADKAGLLVYPSDTYSQKRLTYHNIYRANSTVIWLIGLPFDADKLHENKDSIRRLLSQIINTTDTQA